VFLAGKRSVDEPTEEFTEGRGKSQALPAGKKKNDHWRGSPRGMRGPPPAKGKELQKKIRNS